MLEQDRAEPAEVVIELPWPAKGLSPNARLHWAPKRKLSKAAREIGAACARAAIRGLPPFPAKGSIEVAIDFHPPDKRHRDDDNMIGAAKSMRDGVADAIGVNDRRWKVTYRVREAVKYGKVVVRLPLIWPQMAPESKSASSVNASGLDGFEWLSGARSGEGC